MLGLALYVTLSLLEPCGWSESAVIGGLPPISYGGISAERRGSDLYFATYAYKYAPDGSRTPTILLRTRGGHPGFDTEIPLSQDQHDVHVELVRQDSTLHLFWATGGPAKDSEHFLLTMLNWKTFESGSWDESQVIHQAKEGLNWFPGTISDLSVDDDGFVHMIVPLSFGNGLVYLKGNGESWERLPAPARTALYVDLEVLSPDTLFTLLVGSEFDMQWREAGEPPATNIVLRPSYDGGNSWSEPFLVSSLGKGTANLPDLIALGSTTLHAAWGESPTGGTFPESIRTAFSNDGGKTWTSPVTISHGGGILRNLDMLKACGQLNIIFEIFRNENDFGIYATSREDSDSGWSTPEGVGHGTGYDVTTTPEGEAHLLFQFMRNEKEVMSGGRGEDIIPKTIIRSFGLR